MRGRSLAALLLVVSLVTLSGCGTLRTRYYMAEGNKAYKGQKYEEAIGYYKKIVGFDPTNWTANYQIAMSYLAMYHPGSTHPKDIEAADNSIASFERLLKLKAPDLDTSEKVRNYYVAVLTAADKTDKVVAYFEAILKADPNNGLIMSQLAQIFAKKGDFQNALKWFEKRCQAEPKNKEAWYTVGVVCWERSYRGGPLVSDEERAMVIEKGQAALDKAMALDPEYFEALAYVKLMWLEKMKLLSAQGKAVEAGDAYTKADETNKQLMELLKKRKAQQAQAPAPAAK